MHIFYGILIFMLSSSILMVAYVWIRDIINRKSITAQIAAESSEPLEEIENTEEILEYPNYMKKTA